MNLVTTNPEGQAVTTSLAIAQGVGMPHKSVIQLTRQNLKDLNEFGLVAFEMRARLPGQHGGGNTEYALLNERQATLLITYMRNTALVREFKVHLVKAFYELAEQRRAEFDPASLSKLDALWMAVESEEKRLQLEQQVAEQAPMVEFTRQVKAAPDAISVAKAAKLLGTGRNRLLAFMRQKGWVTRLNEPYQRHIESGYLDVKIGEWEHPDKGLQRSVTTLVTGKGLSKLQRMLAH